MKTSCIGYVVGIMYNSEGTVSEWLFGVRGDLESCGERTRIFKTEKAAIRFKNSISDGTVFVRKYYIIA